MTECTCKLHQAEVEQLKSILLGVQNILDDAMRDRSEARGESISDYKGYLEIREQIMKVLKQPQKKYRVTLEFEGPHGADERLIGEFPTRKTVNTEIAKRDKMQEVFTSQPNSDDLIVPDEIKDWEGGDVYVENTVTGKRWYVATEYEGMKWELETENAYGAGRPVASR